MTKNVVKHEAQYLIFTSFKRYSCKQCLALGPQVLALSFPTKWKKMFFKQAENLI